MSEFKPVSFHVVDDFKVMVGKDQQELSIPRISFSRAGRVVQVVGEAIAEDSGMVLEIIGESRRADTLLTRDAFSSYSEKVKKVIPMLMNTKNITAVKNLLKFVSCEIITDEIIDEMQYSEAVELAAYLINQNFEPLKNLSASLEAIGTSDQSRSK